MPDKINIFWFRRDLRLDDNAGLYHALRAEHPVLPIFIFDTNILKALEHQDDSRVEFIYDAVNGVAAALEQMGSAIEIFHDSPDKAFRTLMDKYDIQNVFTNHDYEPYATERDGNIRSILNERKIPLHTFKDQVIFDKEEVMKDDGTPYSVFTPYSKRWLAKLNAFHLRSYPTEKYYGNFIRCKPLPVPPLESLGFKKGSIAFPGKNPDPELIRKYHLQRDYPGIAGTTRIGVHLRFGTVSIRKLASLAKKENAVYLSELIWRDFYAMILWRFPNLGKGRAFKKEYENIRWRNDESEFARWCTGTTGYPIVDAGMRQMNQTGFMHNRVRMITASFLAKHLLIDWRWGEAYFAEKLLDYDLASNNGGWQWAAGCGCDAAPYFRVFNPTLQTKKFDSKLTYVRQWVPEFESFDYPAPIVEHEFARQRCLEAYSKAVRRNLP